MTSSPKNLGHLHIPLNVHFLCYPLCRSRVIIATDVILHITTPIAIFSDRAATNQLRSPNRSMSHHFALLALLCPSIWLHVHSRETSPTLLSLRVLWSTSTHSSTALFLLIHVTYFRSKHQLTSGRLHTFQAHSGHSLPLRGLLPSAPPVVKRVIQMSCCPVPSSNHSDASLSTIVRSSSTEMIHSVPTAILHRQSCNFLSCHHLTIQFSCTHRIIICMPIFTSTTITLLSAGSISSSHPVDVHLVYSIQTNPCISPGRTRNHFAFHTYLL